MKTLSRKLNPISLLLCYLVVGYSWNVCGEILIEAEKYSRKEPAKGDFAHVSKDDACSGGENLSRFFLPGRCYYDFVIQTNGLYRGWLRYAKKTEGGNLPVTLNPARGGQTVKVTLPATGGLDGPGVWKWVRLFEHSLAKGKHTLALDGCPIRPDCLFISTSADPPALAIEKPLPTKTFDTATLERLRKPIEPVLPDWLKDCRDYQLPAWYDAIRVCAHTRFGPPMRDQEMFFAAEFKIAALGFKEFCRHIKSGNEGAWWPSKVGKVEDWAASRNVAREIIDNAHTQGLRFFAYNRHMEDAFMAVQHPDWVCVGPDGKPLRTKRGSNMCFNSPYVDYLIQRQLELVDMGVDGFYYDEVHMPKLGCWCRYCREKFKAETGFDHPDSATPNEPVYRKLLEFNTATIERAFVRIRKALHARKPELVMLIGSNLYPTLADPHLSHRLFRIADAMKTEFSLPARVGGNRIFTKDASLKPIPRDVRIAMGYALARDAADGRPPHVWCHGLLDGTSAMFATAGMIAHGCVANLDNAEKEIPDATKFAEAVKLGNRVAPAFAGARPLKWAAVHFPELARNQYLPDESAAWKQAIYPAVGAFQVLLRAHLPVRILTDSQMEDGSLTGYQVLFLSAPEYLTDGMKQQIATFKGSGGLVIENREDWKWHDPHGGQEQAMDNFKKLISPALVTVPVQVFGGEKTMHVIPFGVASGKRLTVALVNDFSWVVTGKNGNEDQAGAAKKAGATKTRDDEGEAVQASATRLPAPCKDVKIVLRKAGQPHRVINRVDGAQLSIRQVGQTYEITVPDFPILAVVEVEY